MNKKGFTLVEVIVSLALLSLIGVAVGISLNKIFKDQEVKNYDEYIEKIKSSALLYANNTVDIINKLNSNYSYMVVTIKELVDKGYINKNLTNPETKEKINQDDSVRIYYNEDYEMLIEYPYTEKDEIYLYTMNYSIKYKSDEQDLCYKGLNGPTLQLVKVGTNDAGSKYDDVVLVSGTNIKAYMEDGSTCYIDTSKIGTYKIRYEYTIDGADVDKSTNKRIAERTLTVKPPKPTITEFNITYKNDINDDNFDAYKAKLNLQASDEKGLNLKYCLVATEINETPNVTSCKGTSTDIQENTWINENSDTNENSNTIEKQNYDINIKDLFSLAEKENKLKISVFVKNDFEEHDSMSNQKIEDGKETIEKIIYVLRNKLTLIYSYDSYRSYLDKYTEISKDFEIGANISKFLNDSKITDNVYRFEGWYTDKNGKGDSSNKYPKIYDDLTFYAKWYKYCTEKDYVRDGNCSKTCGGGTKTVYYNDRHDSSHSCNEKGVSCNPQACPTTTTAKKCYRTQGECKSVTGYTCPKYTGDGNHGYAEGEYFCTS